MALSCVFCCPQRTTANDEMRRWLDGALLLERLPNMHRQLRARISMTPSSLSRRLELPEVRQRPVRSARTAWHAFGRRERARNEQWFSTRRSRVALCLTLRRSRPTRDGQAEQALSAQAGPCNCGRADLTLPKAAQGDIDVDCARITEAGRLTR
jgi:hypothetical protein